MVCGRGLALVVVLPSATHLTLNPEAACSHMRLKDGPMADDAVSLGQIIQSCFPHFITKEFPMQLMTEEIRRILPPLGSQDGKGGDAIACVKYFTPDSSWTWYATEFDGEDTLFGLVDGHEKELGYWSLSELQSVRGLMGLAVERDLYWRPKPLREIAPELFEPVREGKT